MSADNVPRDRMLRYPTGISGAMKRVGLLFAMLSLCASGAWAQPSGQISTLHAAATLTNDEASKHFPVAFEATVTHFRSYDENLFVQEGSDAIYVHATTSLKLTPGDRILVRGTMHESFRPFVNSNDITLLGHGALPKPEHPSFEQMIRAETDCRFVTVRAFVRSADLVPDSRSPKQATYLRMTVDGGQADANIDSDDEDALKGLLDAEVQITGVVSGHFDNKMQQTGILFHIQSMAGVKILKRAGSDPWSLPVTPMDRVITGYRPVDSSQRLRVQGTITYYQPGSALVLQDGSRSLWIATETYSPLRIGDRASAIGFPDVQNGFLTLTRSEVRDSSIQAPVAAELFTWRELALGGNEGHSRTFDLVSVEGQVITEVRQATQDEYVLDSDDHLLSAIVRHPGSVSTVLLAPMREIPVGTRIRVTGICMLADANPFNGEVPFNILMRNVDDIRIVAPPPWMNVRHLVMIVGILLAMVIALGMRGWYVENRNRRRIGSLAYVEQRRSKNPRRHQRFQAPGGNSGEDHSVGLSKAERRVLLVPGGGRSHSGQPPGSASLFVSAHRRTPHRLPFRFGSGLCPHSLRRSHQSRCRGDGGTGHGGGIGHPGDRNVAPPFRSRSPLGV